MSKIARYLPWTTLGLLGLIGLMVVLHLGPRLLGSIFNIANRVVVISADTTAAAVTFREPEQVWVLQKAIRCTKKARFDRKAEQEEGAVCSAKDFKEDKAARNYSLHWRADDRAEVRSLPGEVRVTLPTGSKGEAEGTVFVLRGAGLARTGLLAGRGTVQLGDAQLGGRAGFVTGGAYEIRERGLMEYAFGAVSQAVKTGTINPYSSVSLQRGNGSAADVSVQLHMGKAAEEEGAIGSLLVSHPGNTEIHVKYFNEFQDFTIYPNWIESLRGSPILLGLTAIVTLLSALSQVASLSLPKVEEESTGPEEKDEDASVEVEEVVAGAANEQPVAPEVVIEEPEVAKRLDPGTGDAPRSEQST